MTIKLKNLTVDGIQGNIAIKVQLKDTDQTYEVSQIAKAEEAKQFNFENPQNATFIFTVFSAEDNEKKAIASIELKYQNINGDHKIADNGTIHILFKDNLSQNQEQSIENDATELGQTNKLSVKTRETRNRELAEKYKLDYDEIYEQALINAKEKYQEVLAKYGAPLNQNQKEIEELQSKIDQNENESEKMNVQPDTNNETNNYETKKVLNSDDE